MYQKNYFQMYCVLFNVLYTVMLKKLKYYFIVIKSVLQQNHISSNILTNSSFFQLYGSIIIFQRKRRNDWFAKLDEDATEVRF